TPPALPASMPLFVLQSNYTMWRRILIRITRFCISRMTNYRQYYLPQKLVSSLYYQVLYCEDHAPQKGAAHQLPAHCAGLAPARAARPRYGDGAAGLPGVGDP